MPIHDWTRVSAGVYRDFHQVWTLEISRALNRGVLPTGYFAKIAPRAGGSEAEPLAQRLPGPRLVGALAVAETPPRLKVSARIDTTPALDARKANRIVIHQSQGRNSEQELGRAVAMIEVVSPGNKDSKHAGASFVEKAVEFLRNGIHVLMIDPFPPGLRDPQGLAQAIWDGVDGEALAGRPSADRPLSVAAFDAGETLTAYVEPIAVGEPWPETPLFLAPGWYVNIPLEQTYMASWAETPEPIRALVAPGYE